MGVGKKYPGSTGGEIFNYYEDDYDKNVAENQYTTARGLKNTVTSKYSFVSGYNNVLNSGLVGGNSGEGSHVLGTNNTVRIGDSTALAIVLGKNNNLQSPGCVLGGSNTINARGGDAIIVGQHNTTIRNIIFGMDNTSQGTSTYNNVVMGMNNSISEGSHKVYAGYGLVHNQAQTNYGYFNNNQCQLSSPHVVIGCGTNFNKKNAIEINNTSCKILNNLQLGTDNTEVNAIDPPRNSAFDSLDQTLATLGTFMKRYQAWETSIVFTPDRPKTATDMPSGFLSALYEAAEAEFTGTYYGVQVRAKFRLSPNSDETILANPVVCYNTDNGTYSHTRGFILKLEKTSSTVTVTMQQGTSIDFGNNDNTFNSYVDSTTTFNVSYIKLKMTAY